MTALILVEQSKKKPLLSLQIDPSTKPRMVSTKMVLHSFQICESKCRCPNRIHMLVHNLALHFLDIARCKWDQRLHHMSLDRSIMHQSLDNRLSSSINRLIPLIRQNPLLRRTSSRSYPNLNLVIQLTVRRR